MKNKFVKLVHLVGFITKKFVTMQGHMNVKKISHKASEASSVLSIYQKMEIFHHDAGIAEVEFQNIKKDEMDRECGTYREKNISYRVLVGKREG